MLVDDLSNIFESLACPDILLFNPSESAKLSLTKNIKKGKVSILYDLESLKNSPLYTISLLIDCLDNLSFEEIDPLLEKLSDHSRYVFATVPITGDTPLTLWESIFSNDYTRMTSSNVKDGRASLFYKSDSSFKDFR